MKKSRHDYCGDLNARSVGPVTAEAAINLPATELAIDIVAIRTAWRAGRSGFGCTDKPDRGERCGDIRERCRPNRGRCHGNGRRGDGDEKYRSHGNPSTARSPRPIMWLYH